MRALFASATAACLISCAEQVSPAPAHPPVVGAVESVSRADTRNVIAIAQRSVKTFAVLSRPFTRFMLPTALTSSFTIGHLIWTAEKNLNCLSAPEANSEVSE
jgi:hypothetical protein